MLVLIEFHSQILGLHSLLKTIQYLWEVVLCSNALLVFQINAQLHLKYSERTSQLLIRAVQLIPLSELATESLTAIL